MQCQQTQKLEAILLLDNQDLQETRKPIRTWSSLFVGRGGYVQTKQLKVKIAGRGMGGEGSVMSLPSSPQFSCAA